MFSDFYFIKILCLYDVYLLSYASGLELGYISRMIMRLVHENEVLTWKIKWTQVPSLHYGIHDLVVFSIFRGCT